MSTEKQLIDVNAAKEYVDTMFPGDPVLQWLGRTMLDKLPKVDADAGTAKGGLTMAICKLGEKGCWKDGKCYFDKTCDNKVLSNGDRIRAMTDEELAEYLTYHNPYHTESNCLKWLQQPAEVE